MNDIFAPLLGNSVVIYMDNILSNSKSHKEHNEHLRHVLNVLRVLRASRLYATFFNCDILNHEIDCLGHVISADGIKVDSRKLKFVQAGSQPTDIKTLRSFFGLATFFKNFVQGFPPLTASLTSLLRNNVPWKWSSECDSAFHRLPSLCF